MSRLSKAELWCLGKNEPRHGAARGAMPVTTIQDMLSSAERGHEVKVPTNQQASKVGRVIDGILTPAISRLVVGIQL